MKYPLISRIFLFLSALLFVISLFVRMIFSTWDQGSLFYIISSAVFLVLSVILDWKAYIAVFKLRVTRKSIHASRPLVIAALILIGINYASTYYPVKVDLTYEKQGSLSVFSRKIAKSFTDTVEFVYLYVPDSDTHDSENAIHASVKRYQDENPNIKYTKYNILQHPDLAERFNLNSQEEALFVVYKDNKERFYRSDENSITQTLLRVSKGRKTIYFSVGHGESSLGEKKGRGLGSLKREVERLFYDTQEINLNNEMLPETAAALIVISPEKELTDKAQEKVMNFFNGGGRVLLAFDPLQGTNADKLLGRLGLKIVPGVVHMDENSLAAAGSHLVSGLVKDINDPVMRGMGSDSVVIFYVTGALEVLSPADHPDLKITPLIVSPATTVLRKGFTKNDPAIGGKASYNLLMHVESTVGKKGQAFVMADGDVFSNQFMYQHLNGTLMFNIFGYLTKDEDIVSEAPPVDIVANDFRVTETGYKMYLGMFIVPLPFLLLALGGFVFYRRRWL